MAYLTFLKKGTRKFANYNSGGAVRVNNVWTSVAGEIDCCEVRYDRKTEKLKLRIVEPPREKKAQPKVAPRKPARGPKL